MEGNFNAIINDSRPVIVDFHAVWCGPCKAQAPVLKQVADELGERIRIIKVDVDKNNKLASRYQIQGVPTVLFLKGTNIVDTLVGLPEEETLQNRIKQLAAG